MGVLGSRGARGFGPDETEFRGGLPRLAFQAEGMEVALVALRTKNVLIAIIVGVASVWVLRILLK